MKYSVITFGCRVNQADSLGLEEQLRAAGAQPAPPETADVVVVNTCSVTATADQGARQTIRRLARTNPGARLVVTGCYATRRPDDVRELPSVVRVVPNDDKPGLLQIIRDACPPADPSTAERFGDGDGSCGAAIEPGVAGRTAFTLRVQTGCAEPCAYCIIPTTRGRPRSVPIEAVLAEVHRVAAAGFKEIALTGVHLGSYGRDLTPRSSLIELLRALERHGRRGRPQPDPPTRSVRLQPDLLFRISSLEPMDCCREVVDLVAEGDCFAPHFHLPLQHASDRVLAAMRRPYAIEEYASLVDGIRTRIPAASIGSDIIVGFPDETDDDFEQLASYLNRSPLTHVHVFPYSDRPGTTASTMNGKVPGAIVRERARVVRDIGQRLATKFRESQVGTVRRGLTLEDGSLVVTDNYLKVRIPPGRARNEFVRVKITSAGDPIQGELC
jgi:threonylcarbamoyladenosine tRNA methylthiotransferase MtaB